MRLSSSFAFIFCAVLSIPVLAQDWRGGQGRLEGKILDPDGKPVANAVVKLDLPGRGGTELKTDAKGHWAILGLANGNWNVDVTAPGFLVKKVTVPVSDTARIPPVEIRLSKPQGPPPELTTALQKGDEGYKAAVDAEKEAEALSGDARAEQEKKARALFAGARAEYEKVLALKPDLGKPLQMQIARCYKKEGNTEKELEHLQVVLDLSPGDSDIKTLMAMEALDGGLVDRAMELLKNVDESTIKSPDIFFNIGVTFLNRNKPENAVAYFTKAVTLDPNYVDGYFQRALTYLGMQKMAESKADFQKVLSLAPAGPQAETAKKALAQLK